MSTEDDLDALFGAFNDEGKKEPENEETTGIEETSEVNEESVQKKRKTEETSDEKDTRAGEEVSRDVGESSGEGGGDMVVENEKVIDEGEEMVKTEGKDDAGEVGDEMMAGNSENLKENEITIGDILLWNGSAPISSSSISTDSKEKTSQSKSEEKKEGTEPERLVATGTSHDKSIRSYSAYPDKNQSSSVEETLEKSKDFVPAKTYDFELDPFQKSAIAYVEKDESVLIAAHTSAGKTAVAEYAIAKSLRDNQRVIYTSPIKALSNQKYRDLQEEFNDVGLMTGDITINPSATCLVMTTEILRSMLYRGSEIMREVAWVIYDEVHYMRDKERGVVWEESIILLPHNVRFVFLSATIPNAQQFVTWIANIHHQPCHVVYTNYRPVPLQHYIFPVGGDGLHLVVDEHGKFRQNNFQKAMATLMNTDNTQNDTLTQPQTKRKRNSSQNKHSQTSDLHRIIKLVILRNLNPVIIFSFSKKDCERFALQLHREDYTDHTEKDLISQVYTNAIESLSQDDKKLPQVEALLPLLKRGIGIHHGGLLPILKEIVEILFSEGLIKILFATETFAIGINMPAKTVVFTNARKWDGKDFRWLTSGEYIQMSGRAGRRGKDDRGIVIQMLDEKMEPTVCKGILYGDPDPLNSSYRISYNMLLNMIRVEDVDPEYLLRASFHQFQQQSDAPALEAQANDFEQQANLILVDDEQTIKEYYQMQQQLHVTRNKILNIIRKPEYLVPFLQSGRIVKINCDHDDYGWGVIITYKRKPGTTAGGSSGKIASSTKTPLHTIDVLLPCVDRHFDSTDEEDTSKKNDMEDQEIAQQGLKWRGSPSTCRSLRPQSQNDQKLIEWRVFSLTFDSIACLSAARIFIPEQVLSAEARKTIGRNIAEVQRRFEDKGGLPILDPIKDMQISSDDFQTLLDRAAALMQRLQMHDLHQLPPENLHDKIQHFATKSHLYDKVRTLRREARACQTMVMKEDLKKMKKVLRQLGHVDASGVIQTKGRTACEVNTANELVVVELVFTGVFNDLSVEQSVALLSCLTFDERIKDAEDGDPAKGLKSYLSNPFYKLQEASRTVAKATIACRIELEEEDFLDKLNPGMMEAVFAWCKGAKFIDVQKLTGTFEGTTIRTLRRLEELLRQLTSASKAIGNHELQEKFEKGSDLIKRDIVFCNSLYL